MSDWNEFFKDHNDYRVETYFYESRRSFTLEEMYQAFKERMKSEVRASGMGNLYDKPQDDE